MESTEPLVPVSGDSVPAALRLGQLTRSRPAARAPRPFAEGKAPAAPSPRSARGGGAQGPLSPESRSARATLPCPAGAAGRCLAASRRPPRRRGTRATGARSSPRGGAASAATRTARRALPRLRRSEARAQVGLAGQKLVCGARGAGEVRLPEEGAAAARWHQAAQATGSEGGAAGRAPEAQRPPSCAPLLRRELLEPERAPRPRGPRSPGAMETRSPPSRLGPSGALKETAAPPPRAPRTSERPHPSHSPHPSSPPGAARRRRAEDQILGAGRAAETQNTGFRSILPLNSAPHLFLPTHQSHTPKPRRRGEVAPSFLLVHQPAQTPTSCASATSRDQMKADF